ncbi:MAG TPA: DUF6036 family nucleotidyltransferase [Pyrinomonadaceae bacterium]|jgi:phage replication-related protein YjqB (UPF0714/DUF867 family)|nr:DUF6036 family nucleotidyltransferase [Pyrinomonadaceae bacterium]
MDLELPSHFKEFLRLLRAEGVEYLLVGGWAVIYHGYPRATKDIDIWIAVDAQNADRVVRTLRKFGFDVALPADLFLSEEKVIRIGNEPNVIEIMTSASGVEFQQCYRQRIETTLDDEAVSLISLRDLRINKRAAGRLKDLADLEELPAAD